MIKGLNTLLYAKLLSDNTDTQYGITSYGPSNKLAGAIEIKPKINQNSAELYADDTLVDSDYSVSTVIFTLTVDDDDDDIFCELIGMKANEDGGYDASVYDESVGIGIGYIEVKGKRKYRVKFYPNAKVKPFDTDAKTREEKVTFQKPILEVTASPLKNGIYKYQKTFSSLLDAIYHLKNLFKNSSIITDKIMYDEKTKTLIIPKMTYVESTNTCILNDTDYDFSYDESTKMITVNDIN